MSALQAGDIDPAARAAALAALQEYQAALALEKAGNAAAAEHRYRRLLDGGRVIGAAAHQLGLLCHARGDAGEAEHWLHRAVVAEPREPVFRNSLGAVLQARGDRATAEQAYTEALALKPDYADACYNLATLFEETGRLDAALALYSRAVELEPTKIAAQTRLGAILIALDRSAEALPHLDYAVRQQPERFEARYYRGWALSKLGRHADALTELGRAQVLRPESFEATLAFANALRDAGQSAAAIDAYWKLMEREPRSGAIHHELNQLAWMSEDHARYLRSFERARELVGEDPELLQLQASFLMRRNGHAQAEQLLRRARELAPQRGDITGLLARAIAGQGRFQDSYPLFVEAIRIEPQMALHRHELGFTLLKDRQPRDAAQVFEQALTLNAHDQLALAGLGLAWRELADQRYFRLVDFARYVGVYDIHAPSGSADVLAFNRALATELDALHAYKREPLDQTLRGGTQTSGHLFAKRTPAIEALREQLSGAIAEYIRGLPDDPAHPVAARRAEQFSFAGSWSCRLAPGGYHDNHVHPQGWISSAYYARLPDGLDDHSAARPGWLRFGESNLALAGKDRAEGHVQPRVGRLVLFPSYFWHGTVPFGDGGDRLAISFDVVPGAPAPGR